MHARNNFDQANTPDPAPPATPDGFAGLPETNRHADRREPQVALRDLPGDITRSTDRIGRQIHRPQLRDPATEDPDRVSPADPLGDHRRRPPRIGRQQLTDPRLGHVDHRPGGLALIPRRPITGDRGPHRVPRNTQHPSDHLEADQRPTVRRGQQGDLAAADAW